VISTSRHSSPLASNSITYNDPAIVHPAFINCDLPLQILDDLPQDRFPCHRLNPVFVGYFNYQEYLEEQKVSKVEAGALKSVPYDAYAMAEGTLQERRSISIFLNFITNVERRWRGRLPDLSVNLNLVTRRTNRYRQTKDKIIKPPTQMSPRQYLARAFEYLGTMQS
jgi:hypothetical protein